MDERLMIEKLKACRFKKLQAYEKDYEMDYLEEKINELSNKLDLVGFKPEILSELREQIQKLELRLFELKRSAIDKQLDRKKIETCVNKLPEIHSIIIKDRYFAGKSIKSIAEKLSYSYQRVYQLQKEALQLLITMQVGG